MLYVVAGNGTGPTKEITGALKDLKDKATQDDVEFWLLLEAKDESTATDKSIVAWLVKNEIWFETISATDATIDGAQASVHADDVYEAFLERIQERAAESEAAALLILPVDPDGETDEDEVLMGLVERAIDGDVPVFALNGEMARITLDEEPEEPDEPEAAPAVAKAATKKAAAKKAAAPAAPAAPTKKAAAKRVAPAADEQDGAPNDDDETVEEAVVYTAEELAKMTVPELGAVARSQGLDVKGMGKRDLVTAIMAQTAAPAVEAPVSLSSLTNGEVLVVIHLPGAIVTKIIPQADALALASA